MKNNIDERTRKIANDNNLQIDGRQFSDPLHRIEMEGDFYRNLMRKNKFAYLRMLFGLISFVLPVLMVILYVISDKSTFFTGEFLPLTVAAAVLLALCLFIGLKMVLSGVKTILGKKIN